MQNAFDLSGKVALVTGANTGIGQAIAISLAAAGADIGAVGRSAPDDTIAQVRALGRKAAWIEANLDAASGLDAVIANAFEQFGNVDILVNNAGTIRRSAALDFTEEDWDAVLGVNLKTAFFLAQAVARRWVAAQRGGKIINVASLLSFQGGIRVASYTASKSGLLGITRLLANEWAAHGLNVNAIAPGYMTTDNTAALRNDVARNKAIVDRIPAGRWGDPRELGGAAVFLCSAASNYVHGHVLLVDGGWLGR